MRQNKICKTLCLSVIILVVLLTFDRCNAAEDATTHYNLGNVYLNKGLYDQAITEFKKAIQLNPDNAIVHYNLAFAYHKKGYFENAEVEYRVAIKLFRSQGKEGSAQKTEERLKDITDSARKCLQKGLIYEEKGMIDEALSEYKKAVSLDSTYSDAFFNIGLIYYKRHQWQESIDAFKRGIELNPLDGEAHWQLALVYGLSEKYTEAIKHYDRAQELNYTGGDPKLGKLLEPHRIKEYNLEYKPLLDRKSEKAVIKIRGNPRGDEILMRDVIQKLEIFEHVSTKGIFEEIDIEFINWEGSKTWFERWRVKGKNTEHDYQIKFMLCPDGGTDIYINLQPKEMKEGKELGEVEDVFDAYRNAVKNRQYSSLARYATIESVQKGYHVMKDFQRANFLKYFDNNPYYVSFRGKAEAIIYFKESRNGTASPYIFTKEAGRWKIDFVKISQKIIYGPGNKWRWR